MTREENNRNHPWNYYDSIITPVAAITVLLQITKEDSNYARNKIQAIGLPTLNTPTLNTTQYSVSIPAMS